MNAMQRTEYCEKQCDYYQKSNGVGSCAKIGHYGFFSPDLWRLAVDYNMCPMGKFKGGQRVDPLKDFVDQLIDL